MHSWVFRNRDQLRLIYGSTPPDGDLDSIDEAQPVPESGGAVERNGNDVILTPMAAVAR